MLDRESQTAKSTKNPINRRKALLGIATFTSIGLGGLFFKNRRSILNRLRRLQDQYTDSQIKNEMYKTLIEPYKNKKAQVFLKIHSCFTRRLCKAEQILSKLSQVSKVPSWVIVEKEKLKNSIFDIELVASNRNIYKTSSEMDLARYRRAMDVVADLETRFSKYFSENDCDSDLQELYNDFLNIGSSIEDLAVGHVKNLTDLDNAFDKYTIKYPERFISYTFKEDYLCNEDTIFIFSNLDEENRPYLRNLFFSLYADQY